ncbi:hypothetical protein [Parapedobacter tibetensis]|uniref:hypothetical protein n=1 Tax=Parapedobacter tibetensis TaxID=2972951 RepID=UPI00214D2BA7|nr:hypothetical protein [Parapedobacter tibetensis]
MTNTLSTICCFMFLTPFLACSQQNTNGIKSINIIDEIDHLENFGDEPTYQLRVNTGYSFTVLINGIPIGNKYVNYLSHYLTEINSCIPNKGEQKIEIQIYPRYVDELTQNESLEHDIGFKLTIEQTAWKDGGMEEPKIIYSYSLPEGDYAGQKSFIHAAIFTAAVPYELIDWRMGRTFDEQDTATLKIKVLQAYEKLISDFENQQGEDYVNALGKGLFNLYQSSYFDKEEALNHINHRISFINKKKRKLAEIANYKLEILGDGKLLSLKRIDGYNRREGVIRRHYKKGPKEMVQVDDILFYAPQSSKSDDLQVIWHRNLVKGANP